jgi:hypothetical protein
MKRAYRKRSYPLNEIRRFLEPGPIVLVSSAWQGSFNVMTMGWHMMLGGGAPDRGVLREFRMPSTGHSHDSNPRLVIWEVVKAHVAMSP